MSLQIQANEQDQLIPALAGDLRRIEIFADLENHELSWLAGLMTLENLIPGEIFVPEGSVADRMFIVLEGRLRGRQEATPDTATYFIDQGVVTGMLPYSRMKVVPVTIRAVVPSRLACLSVDHFPKVLTQLPQLGPRFVGVLADRIRFVARDDLQRDKLMALGKLAAGLAHEINNPAAAILRAAESLRSSIGDWQKATSCLESLGVTQAQRESLRHCEIECSRELDTRPVLDSIGQSDREEDLAAKLARAGVSDGWKLAPALIETGFDDEDLHELRQEYPGPALGSVLTRFTATLAIERLLREVQACAGRISELVCNVKEYSFMDQAPVQEVDVHRGLEATLSMLQYRMGTAVTVVRQYDCSLPVVMAYGGELNQVWTNLIENALDAMKDRGELQLRTVCEFDGVLIEVIDNGPGIPAEIEDRIFEPFFTTKAAGEATGLGLDTVYRVVRKHGGSVLVDSKPGRTAFQVRLPFGTSAAGQAAGR